MKLAGLLFVCVLPVACATTSVQDAVAAAPAPSSNSTPPSNVLQIHVGGRGLDKSDWDPVEDQIAYQLEVVHEPPSWPLGFEVGLAAGFGAHVTDASGSDIDTTSSIAELFAGAHKTFLRESDFQPFVGGGVTLLNAEFKTDVGNSSVSDDDTSAGLYLHGGLQIRIARSFFIGLDLRAVFGTDIELFGSGGNADYGQASVFLGVGL
jgi:opacity protein-like surface antigen